MTSCCHIMNPDACPVYSETAEGWHNSQDYSALAPTNEKYPSNRRGLVTDWGQSLLSMTSPCFSPVIVGVCCIFLPCFSPVEWDNLSWCVCVAFTTGRCLCSASARYSAWPAVVRRCWTTRHIVCCRRSFSSSRASNEPTSVGFFCLLSCNTVFHCICFIVSGGHELISLIIARPLMCNSAYNVYLCIIGYYYLNKTKANICPSPYEAGVFSLLYSKSIYSSSFPP